MVSAPHARGGADRTLTDSELEDTSYGQHTVPRVVLPRTPPAGLDTGPRVSTGHGLARASRQDGVHLQYGHHVAWQAVADYGVAGGVGTVPREACHSRQPH